MLINIIPGWAHILKQTQQVAQKGELITMLIKKL